MRHFFTSHTDLTLAGAESLFPLVPTGTDLADHPYTPDPEYYVAATPAERDNLHLWCRFGSLCRFDRGAVSWHRKRRQFIVGSCPAKTVATESARPSDGKVDASENHNRWMLRCKHFEDGGRDYVDLHRFD
jgi:hypothetical protein